MYDHFRRSPVYRKHFTVIFDNGYFDALSKKTLGPKSSIFNPKLYLMRHKLRYNLYRIWYMDMYGVYDVYNLYRIYDAYVYDVHNVYDIHDS